MFLINSEMKIHLDRKNCIGCGLCAAICPRFFGMGEDGKSTLKKGVLNKKDGSEELKISSIECAQDAADSCPVQVIHVIA